MDRQLELSSKSTKELDRRKTQERWWTLSIVIIAIMIGVTLALLTGPLAQRPFATEFPNLTKLHVLVFALTLAIGWLFRGRRIAQSDAFLWFEEFRNATRAKEVLESQIEVLMADKRTLLAANARSAVVTPEVLLGIADVAPGHAIILLNTLREDAKMDLTGLVAALVKKRNDLGLELIQTDDRKARAWSDHEAILLQQGRILSQIVQIKQLRLDDMPTTPAQPPQPAASAAPPTEEAPA